jgi:hypothetical protein
VTTVHLLRCSRQKHPLVTAADTSWMPMILDGGEISVAHAKATA